MQKTIKLKKKPEAPVALAQPKRAPRKFAPYYKADTVHVVNGQTYRVFVELDQVWLGQVLAERLLAKRSKAQAGALRIADGAIRARMVRENI